MASICALSGKQWLIPQVYKEILKNQKEKTPTNQSKNRQLTEEITHKRRKGNIIIHTPVWWKSKLNSILIDKAVREQVLSKIVWECKIKQLSSIRIWKCLAKLCMHLSFHPAFPLLRIYPTNVATKKGMGKISTYQKYLELEWNQGCSHNFKLTGNTGVRGIS